MVGPGLFGKLPQAGDFVARGLSTSERRILDGWVTRHLAARRNYWPDGGLRGFLVAGDATLLMVSIASRDSVGRAFPLVAATNGDRVSFEDADAWCDFAVGALEEAAGGSIGTDEAYAALKLGKEPQRTGPIAEPSVWIAGSKAQDCVAEALDGIFSSD